MKKINRTLSCMMAALTIAGTVLTPVTAHEVNVEGTLNVLQAARDLGGVRVVHTSTSEVYGTAQYVPINEKHPLQPQSPYSASKIAADALETSAADLEIADGLVRIAGTDRTVSFADLAKRPGVDPAKREASASFASADGTFPNGTHVVEIELDPGTGKIKIVNYVIVDDFGVLLNPMLVEGQIHGGVAQGIGQALLEGAVYDADGQVLTGSFMDYCMPRADSTPAFDFAYTEVPTPRNAMGIKGAGEGGTIPAPAAIVAAIEHALSPFGVHFRDMPLTPERIVAALRAAGAYDKLSAA